MACGQLAVLGLVLACVSDALLHGGRQGVGVQKSPAAEAKPAAAERKPSRRLQTRPGEAALAPLTWKYPEDPVSPTKALPPRLEPPRPAASDRLAVRCGQSKVFVEVSQDLLGLGKLVEPEELTLGGCAATEVDHDAHVLVFESDLHGCGSKLVMTDDVFIYAFLLLYRPRLLGGGVIARGRHAAIGVECHYKRRSSISAGPLSSSRREAQEHPHFSLKLMADDWSAERSSNRYSLADALNVEASVMQSERLPLRMLVDHCVASIKPGFTSEPRQELVKNHGCLGGRRSRSRFMPRSRPETLQFQVEASSLRPLRLLFISCHVKAVPATLPPTIQHKACSFSDGRWRAVSGRDQFCSCCGSTCGMRKARHVDSETDVKWDAELVVGPIVIQ